MLGVGLSLTSQRRRASAWNPGQLPGTPREWLAGSDWCYTDGSAAFNGAGTAGLTSGDAATMASPDWSVSAWVKPVGVVPSGGDGVVSLFTNTSGATGNFSVAMLATAVLEVVFWNGVAMRKVNASGVFTAGTWKHVVAGVTSGVPWAYVNGSVVSLSTDIGAGTGWGTGFGLGAYYAGTSDPWNGSIAASGLWSRTLTPTEITSLYNGGLGKVYADLTTGEKVGLTSFWDLTRSGVYTDSHGANNLTATVGGGGAITFGAGLPRARAGDTDPISAWVDRWQGTTVSQSDPLKRPTLRLVSGKWCVRFDGVNDRMQGVYTRTQPHECFYVGTMRNDSKVASDGYAGGSTAYIWCDTVSAAYRYLIYPGEANVGSVVSTDGARVILRGLFNGAASEVQVNNGTTITGSGGTLAAAGLTLGSVGGGAGGFHSAVDINSFVDAGQAIDPADRARLWAYLNALWGVY